MLLTRLLTTAFCIVSATSATAWWGGGPWGGSGWNNSYNNGYGRGYGGMGGEQYRGGDATGGGDFSMNLSGRGNTNLRGYGSGYGAGDGWGRDYNWRAPYYGGYAPYAYGSPPMSRTYPGYAATPQPQSAPTASRYDGVQYGSDDPQDADASAEADGERAVVTDAAGMTLYTYAQDRIGESNCYGQCARSWPPAPVADDSALAADLTAVTRRDGTRQLALDGQPLYLWVGDQKPGDTSGDGIGGVWSAARR